MSDIRSCPGCKRELDVENFRENAGIPGGRNVWCNDCQKPTFRPSVWSGSRPTATRAASMPRAGKPSRRPERDAERKSTRPPVLVINSYAGSLLLAARSLGVDVLGSYEDSGFGTQHQIANFPELEGLFASSRESWPTGDLPEDTVVIAHPPCAAFSVQAKGSIQRAGKKKHGAESDHFKCTVDVMRYSMGRKCAALLIESVQGANEGGKTIHDTIAEEFGYDVYRVLQNAATFGVPQWRPRFWITFVRRGVAARIAMNHQPRAVSVADIVAGGVPEPDPVEAEWYDRQWKFLAQEGISPENVALLRGKHGVLASNIAGLIGGEGNSSDFAKRYCLPAPNRLTSHVETKTCAWVSETLRTLDPQRHAPTLMHNSWWAVDGRTLAAAEYRAIMGFPRDYILDRDYRMYLSKGVCPPVAAWLLDTVLSAVEGHGDNLGERAHWLEPGQTIDLSIGKRQWDQLAGIAPPDEEEAERPAASAGRTESEGAGAGKKRVSLACVFVLSKSIAPGALQDAFASRKEVVAPPLREFEALNADCTRVKIVAQYEPPNKGGSRSDVERIVDRARRTLDSMGYGPVTVERC